MTFALLAAAAALVAFAAVAWKRRRGPTPGSPDDALRWLEAEASEYQRQAFQAVRFFAVEQHGLDPHKAFVYALGAAYSAARADGELRDDGRAIVAAAWEHLRDPAAAARFTRWLERELRIPR